jgi:hypothetical protein
MPTILKTKNSVTTTVVPTTLQQGELAVNITDKKVWVGNAATTPVQLLGAGASGTFGALTVTSLTDSGNLTFTGTGNRITGDFSNATASNRVIFQTSTASANTRIGIMPSSTSTGTSGPVLYSTNDPNNSSIFDIRITDGGSASLLSTQSGTGANLPFTIQTGGSERLRIDTSGNVGIGTTSPTRALTVFTTAATDNNLLLISGAANAYLCFADVTTTDQTGLSVRIGSSGNNLVFNTGGTTERMRIDSSGNLLVGTTTSFPGSGNTTVGFMYENAGTLFASRASGIALNVNRNDDGNLVSIRRSGTEVGSIGVTTLLTTYATTSDYRLKTVVAPVSDAGTRLDALQPIEYDWKAGGRTRGFLAHQFAEVYPSSVTGKKDAVDEEGKPVYQGMQASTPEVMADLIAEIQSLRKRVAQLESK